MAPAVRLEVEVVQEDGGLFRATAVPYPEVSVTGRTEKEALGLLLEAIGKYLKGRPEPA
jgi:predicted RNase H-like HicB family nuclease